MKYKNTKLNKDFFTRSDVLRLSRELLGKILVSCDHDGLITSGIIVETEAYKGISDRASHAYNGRRTKRNAVMYEEGGRAYVYLIYGMYAMFNIVTGKKGWPDAVLVRALEPVEGIAIMLKRRGQNKISPRLCNGPGRLTKAMGITINDSGLYLTGNRIWLEKKPALTDDKILSGRRIGIDYAAEDAAWHWRFIIKNNPWISKGV